MDYEWKSIFGTCLIFILIDTGLGDEGSLYKHIINGLSKQPQVRPRVHHEQPVHVELEYELIKIISVDEKTQVMTSVGFFVAEWYDDHLKWEPEVFGHQDEIVVPPNTIWLPDFGIANSASSFYDTSFRKDFRVRIRYDGRVKWSFGGEVSTICTLDMTFYPIDLQKCSIQIENWAYTGDEVAITNKTDFVAMDAYETNGVWKIVGTQVEHFNHKFITMGDIVFPEVRFSLFMQRKAMFYVLNLIVPCALIIIVALAVYWLPADSGEKVSLGVTVLLAFSVFQLVIADQTPVNSDYTPVLSRMVISIMSLSSVSVLTSIWVLYLHHKDSSRVVPHCIKVFAFKGMATFLCMRASVPQVHPQEKVSPQPDDLATMVTDDEINGRKLQCTNPAIPDLTDILENLVYMTDKMKEKEEEEIIMAEWRAVAKILDRFLFWLSFLVVGIIFVVLITQQDTEH